MQTLGSRNGAEELAILGEDIGGTTGRYIHTSLLIDGRTVAGLTTAYCHAARNEPGDGKLSWPARIGSFATVAYSQVRHPEKQASAEPGKPPASEMSPPAKPLEPTNHAVGVGVRETTRQPRPRARDRRRAPGPAR